MIRENYQAQLKSIRGSFTKKKKKHVHAQKKLAGREMNVRTFPVSFGAWLRGERKMQGYGALTMLHASQLSSSLKVICI